MTRRYVLALPLAIVGFVGLGVSMHKAGDGHIPITNAVVWGIPILMAANIADSAWMERFFAMLVRLWRGKDQPPPS